MRYAMVIQETRQDCEMVLGEGATPDEARADMERELVHLDGIDATGAEVREYDETTHEVRLAGGCVSICERRGPSA